LLLDSLLMLLNVTVDRVQGVHVGVCMVALWSGSSAVAAMGQTP